MAIRQSDFADLGERSMDGVTHEIKKPRGREEITLPAFFVFIACKVVVKIHMTTRFHSKYHRRSTASGKSN